MIIAVQNATPVFHQLDFDATGNGVNKAEVPLYW